MRPPVNTTPVMAYDPIRHLYFHADGGTSTAEELRHTGITPADVPSYYTPKEEAILTHITDQLSAWTRDNLFTPMEDPHDPRA